MTRRTKTTSPDALRRSAHAYVDQLNAAALTMREGMHELFLERGVFTTEERRAIFAAVEALDSFNAHAVDLLEALTTSPSH